MSNIWTRTSQLRKFIIWWTCPDNSWLHTWCSGYHEQFTVFGTTHWISIFIQICLRINSDQSRLKPRFNPSHNISRSSRNSQTITVNRVQSPTNKYQCMKSKTLHQWHISIASICKWEKSKPPTTDNTVQISIYKFILKIPFPN